MSDKVNPDKQISIYCLQFVYKYKNGTTEYSKPKYCGNSPEHCFEAISKLLGACQSVLPESVAEVSFNIQGYCRDSYSNSRDADLVVPSVVCIQLRNYYEGACSE